MMSCDSSASVMELSPACASASVMVVIGMMSKWTASGVLR